MATSRNTVWDNKDGLVVGFGTRSSTRAPHRKNDEGALQSIYMDFDWSDLPVTSVAATDDQLVHGPVIPSGAVVVSAHLTVVEAFAGGTNINFGMYNAETAAVVDADGLIQAEVTADIDAIGDIVNYTIASTGASAGGADLGTVVAVDTRIAGFATGIGVGFALGLVVGRLGVKQKPWSELTDNEKRVRKIVIVAGSLLLLLGIAAIIWVVLSR